MATAPRATLHRRIVWLGATAILAGALLAAATPLVVIGADASTGASGVLALTLGLSAAVLATLGAAFLVLLRRWVAEPVRALVADTQRVAAGDLEHEVKPTGPGELEQLARDIEAMRVRILEELQSSNAARAILDAQANDLRRSNAELEQFAYVASHDLQEPLRKVASFCQLLERRYSDQLDDKAKQYIEFAVDGAKRMQSLINDLLAFSRVGRTRGTFEPVDLGEVVRLAVADLGSRIDEEGATVDVPEDLPSVPGDESLLRTVFVNVIGNALKFRGEEVPKVALTVEGAGDMWAIRIADNGIGIPEAYAERVFVIFQRLHGRDEYSGTGIGLALCRKIIEFHGGRIWVEPGDGPGTTLHITLPRA